MSELTSYFTHGFNSDHNGWESFFLYNPHLGWSWNYSFIPEDEKQLHKRLQEEKNPAFPTNIINWDSGNIGDKFDSMISAIVAIFDADEVTKKHEQWSNANERAIEAGELLAYKINSAHKPGDHVVLSAHSLGTVVLYQAVQHIRKDITIYLFMMAGVLEKHDLEWLLFTHKNIALTYNLYSYNDHALNSILPKFEPTIDEPIGNNAISSDIHPVCDINTGIDHSEYKTDSVRKIFVEFSQRIDAFRNSRLGKILLTYFGDRYLDTPPTPLTPRLFK
ncbi:hypothetical protein [Pseudomonas sp. UW4]|uniref:hypothetical protein n=1 Tax=Pseudomonas sp. UW4 TaxID=1207075 RepID=UPI00029CEE70|nr:hypothetical protein [Pseudomonas sp. UW4]AFY19363.1 hypothetical protein PputUW4_02164 [Pseudomonas sp. UW4]